MLQRLVTVTRLEAERSLAVVEELQVMLGEMQGFRDKEVKQVEKMYKMVEKKAQDVYKLSKQGDKKSVEAEQEQIALETLTQTTLERVEKTNGRWQLMSHTIVEWWLVAKMSGCKDRYRLMKDTKARLPEMPPKEMLVSPRSPPSVARREHPPSPRGGGAMVAATSPTNVRPGPPSPRPQAPRKRFSDNVEQVIQRQQQQHHVTFDERSHTDGDEDLFNLTSPSHARKVKGILKNKAK